MELGLHKTQWNSPGVHGTDFVADSVPRLGTLLARFVADFYTQKNIIWSEQISFVDGEGWSLNSKHPFQIQSDSFCSNMPKMIHYI